MKSLLRASVNVLPMWLRQSIRHIPGVAASQRWVVNNVLAGESFVHTINAGPAAGLRFEISLPEDKAIWAGTFEPVFGQALRNATGVDDICYDIGGYRGYMSGVFALAGAKQVIVFEPLPENVRRLKRLTELNPHLAIQIEQTAIGKADGNANFAIMPDRSMGKLSDSSFQKARRAVQDIVVPVTRLDTYVFQKQAAPPTVLKIDVEGAELDVLEGATRVLTEHRPKIFFEAHSKELAAGCRQKLVTLGYRLDELQDHPDDHDGTRHFVAQLP